MNTTKDCVRNLSSLIAILLLVGFFILLAIVVFFIIGWMARKTDSETLSQETELKKKYEKGEISKEEFEQMKKNLS